MSPSSPLPDAATAPPSRLRRGLTVRHIQFMALGSAIGTGLFYGSSAAIQAAGPAVLLVYIVAGAAVFMVMRAMGEMAVRIPVPGAFSEYATEFLGPFAGYVTGWTYVFEMLVVAIADVTALTLYMGLWFPDTPRWIWAAAVLLIIAAVNLRHVKVFGELEFWFTLVKVAAIVAMIVGGVALLAIGSGVGSTAPGLSHLVDHGGFAPNGPMGLLAALTLVVFAFGGVETIGITAGEAEDPDRAVPKAVNTVPVRILLFYVLALGVIMSLVPWTQIDGEASPFVPIFEALGVPYAPHILNAVVVTAAISSINADTFGSGRMLYALAESGQAPRVFTSVSRAGVPWASVLVMIAALAVGVVLNAVVPENAFEIIASLATFATVWVWLMILLSHLAMRRRMVRDGVRADRFPVPLWPVASWAALAFIIAVIALLAVFPETRIALVVGLVWLVLLGAVYAVTLRKPRQRLG
ncbi:amino acid permease [Brachybacterium nesterenkovii]|uniref:amino acid permease n=1 Tax=Brachybacterium nesterenkovii TaxID=47847 RepID=UPI0032196C2C